MTELIKKQNRYLQHVHAISFIDIESLEGTFRINYKDEGGIKRKASDNGKYEKDTNPEDYDTTTEGVNTGMDNEEEEGEKVTNLTDGTNDTEMSEDGNKSIKTK